MAKNHGYMVYASTIFAENKKDVLYSGQVESDSIVNALAMFASSCQQTKPDSLISDWKPEDGLPVLTVQIQSGSVALRREVAIGGALIGNEDQPH